MTYRYQVGGSLNVDTPTYVERQADLQLYQALKQGDFCYIFNSRQMGKSSLLVRTKHRLQQEGFKCAAVDLSVIGSENITVQQWYKGIVGDLWLGFQLVESLKLKAWWREQEDFSLLTRLKAFLEELLFVQFAKERLVIFVDEVDSILGLDFSVDDFFALIRFCYNQRAINPEYQRLSFAIFGVATPSDLIQDKTRTPFNIGKAIELEGLKFAEAGSLIKGLEKIVQQPERVIKEILNWTGGQPFLTQKVCQLIVQSSQAKTDEEKRNLPLVEKVLVENIVKKYIINRWESQDEPEHLRTIRDSFAAALRADRIERNEQLAARMLGIYQQILQPPQPPLSKGGQGGVPT
uniref:AAA-like domain-containing protein n=1 Tax=Brasilonema sp. UFV-L1 TaxID=2234130 RepID=UPI0016AED58A